MNDDVKVNKTQKISAKIDLELDPGLGNLDLELRFRTRTELGEF